MWDLFKKKSTSTQPSVSNQIDTTLKDFVRNLKEEVDKDAPLKKQRAEALRSGSEDLESLRLYVLSLNQFLTEDKITYKYSTSKILEIYLNGKKVIDIFTDRKKYDVYDVFIQDRGDVRNNSRIVHSEERAKLFINEILAKYIIGDVLEIKDNDVN